MINLPKPKLKAEKVFADCISKIKNADLKERMGDVAEAITAASGEYERLAARTRLHELGRDQPLGAVTIAEMEAVYTNRMAKKKAPGRYAYDEIFNSSPNARCPLCGHRKVSTLDHHLPKSHYPAFPVAPINLVPACTDCNKAKLASIPVSADSQALHPYFDNINDKRWLYGKVLEVTPVVIEFRVIKPEEWSDVLSSRVDLHFNRLGLGPLYSAEAVDELENIRHQLISLHGIGGAELVRSEMIDRAASARKYRLNGWRTATFEAFAASEWFCDGGFQE
ncbi:hypothetical protein N5J06_14085 [Ralstonia sp. CHL-2022]|uniref:HNH endonuclease n=1 Tax=Ralstonia mojiangensis TaxID=2953895 RepID=A0ABT2LA51_9RALS|nr:hypothetical protein [Ralstonia mojiangensis]MCT7312089.1 hypothetical protein [Ralstonia mojiangensis]